MVTCYAGLVAWFLVSLVPLPEPPATLPAGPQPQIVLARFDGMNQLLVQTLEMVPVTMEKTEKRMIDGKLVDIKSIVTTYQGVVKTSTLPTEGMRFFDSDGRPVPIEKARQILNQNAPLLLARDGKPVEPFYLKLYRPGILVAVSAK